MGSMGYLGMISVPIPRLRTESADADEVGHLHLSIRQLVVLLMPPRLLQVTLSYMFVIPQ